ncbi:MAG: MBL fold metallo-hydrolase [Bacteroidales bacterium]|nr:MBL fold metallo-hydrolase [Bacteroidales bacterium]
MNKNRMVVLSDHRTSNPLLQTEHGLSIYMESPSGKYLLDTGASDLFIHNAEVLGIDLADIDYCLVSHGHSDHIGGLPAFMQINQKAKVILSANIPGAEYVSVRRYQHSITGNTDFSQQKDRFIFIHENTIVGNIHVYANIGQKHAIPLGNQHLLTRDGVGNYVSDTFCHELAFIVDGVLFTGCAHHGLLNILEAVKEPVKMSIGGFHLLDSHLHQHYESDEQLQAISSCLGRDYPDIRFYTGHCTGDHCYDMLAKSNNNLHQFHCGDEIT